MNGKQLVDAAVARGEMCCAACGYPVSNKAALLDTFECPQCRATNYVGRNYHGTQEEKP
jgi:hypothetical protein